MEGEFISIRELKALKDKISQEMCECDVYHVLI